MARALAGRYELEVPLGRGASGEVWRGRDLATRKPVAVKLVQLAEIGDSALIAQTIARFRREAATLARLRHPNIVAALEAGRIDNELFLVMELAEGTSLASMLDQRIANNLGLLPVSSVLRVAEQACAGLAAAHSAGVVHRDIKPSNLMVATRLDTKIIDFGIARLLHDNSPRLTRPRQQMGTLAYISPEQLEDNDVDGRADLYSLGCVLYEQLAGRPPFVAEVPSALMQMQLKQRPAPLDTLRSDLPVGLARLVDRLMEKDRSARPDDATQVLRYIAAISAGAGQGKPALEADRQTVSKPAVLDGEQPAAPGLVRPEADRQTVVAGETLPAPAARTAAKAGQPRAGQPRAQPLFVPRDQGGGPAYERTEPSLPTLEPPAGPPAGDRDQAAQRPPGPPEWPGPRRASTPRRAARWRGAVSTLVTLAVAAGLGVFLWDRTHQPLAVSGVAVSLAGPPPGCEATVGLVATITTNGKGGPIAYEWIRDSNEAGSPATVTDQAGHDTVQVTLTWSFHGKGTQQATAQLRVLTPNVASGSAHFTYSCA